MFMVPVPTMMTAMTTWKSVLAIPWLLTGPGAMTAAATDGLLSN